MKNCGKRFHSEVGKFRFLNELIKVVSPKVGRPRDLHPGEGEGRGGGGFVCNCWACLPSVPGLAFTGAREEEGPGVDLQLDRGAA